MFPIRDHNPSGRTPFVTLALIAVNVVVFLAYWFALSGDAQLGRFFLQWGLVPARIGYGEGYETFVTSMFLHGGWMHLLGNMLFLYIFGDNLEDEMGHFRFLVFYLISGLGAAGLQFAADPASMIPMVGASGAIAGVMGGYLLLFPKARVDVLIIFIVAIPYGCPQGGTNPGNHVLSIRAGSAGCWLERFKLLPIQRKDRQFGLMFQFWGVCLKNTFETCTNFRR